MAFPGEEGHRRRGESGGKARGVHAAPNGGLGSPGGGRRRRFHGEGRSSCLVAAGEGVLVAQGRGFWVLEHHQSTRSARMGSGEAMRGGGDGSTASSSSPAPMAVVDGVWAREGARGRFIGGEGEGGRSWECSAPYGGG